jgi:hypothetical protein
MAENKQKSSGAWVKREEGRRWGYCWVSSDGVFLATPLLFKCKDHRTREARDASLLVAVKRGWGGERWLSAVERMSHAPRFTKSSSAEDRISNRVLRHLERQIMSQSQRQGSSVLNDSTRSLLARRQVGRSRSPPRIPPIDVAA